MGIVGTDYQMGRVLAGVAVAHGRGGGSLSRDGLDRTYQAHSALTSVHPYVAFDLSEDLTVWGQGGWGRGEMALSESVVRKEGMEQAGAYRAGSVPAVGVRGGWAAPSWRSSPMRSWCGRCRTQSCLAARGTSRRPRRG